MHIKSLQSGDNTEKQKGKMCFDSYRTWKVSLMYSGEEPKNVGVLMYMAALLSLDYL